MISVDKLIAAGIGPTQAKLWALPLNGAASYWAINTPVREAMFIAQLAHESSGFTATEEDLFYSKPERILQIFKSSVHDLEDAARLAKKPQALANRVYSNRLGNGNEASGDGWKYRGRGLIQLTGRDNYRDAAQQLGVPYEAQPELVAEPRHASHIAGWFFSERGCLPHADASNVEAVTRIINGAAMAGLDDRRRRFERALQAFQ